LSSFSEFALAQYNFTNISGIKTDQTALQASAGGMVQFTINITNTGTEQLTVTVNDTLPSGLTFNTSSPANDSYTAPNIYTWTFTLNGGTTEYIYLNATVDAGVVDESTPVTNLTNILNVSGLAQNGTIVTANDSANVTVYYANISVIKLDQSGTEYSTGGLVQFNITVTNTGNVTLNVTVNDTLPSGLTFNASSPTNSSFTSPRSYGWNFTLASGATQVIYINATVDEGVVDEGTQITNLTNYVNATGIPPNGDNLFAEDYVNVTIYYANASILKTDLTALQPSAGGLVQYKINITNTGSAVLNPVLVIDTLPENLTYNASYPSADSVVGQIITWDNVGPIAASSSYVIYLNATINSTAGNNTYTNSVNVTASPENGNNITDSDTVDIGVNSSAMSMTKEASSSTATAGDTIDFTITIVNTGTTNLTITAIDTLSSHLTYLSSSPSETSTVDQTIYWAEVVTIDPGETTTINYSVTAASAGTATNNLTVYGVPPNGNNVSDNTSVEIVISPVSSGDVSSETSVESIPRSDALLSWERNCPDNELGVTVRKGSAISGATIKLMLVDPYIGIIDTKRTGGSGKVVFTLEQPGTYRIIASHSDYTFDNPYEFEYDSCSDSITPECAANDDCNPNQVCTSGNCVALTGTCGYARGHAWFSYLCCNDEDCGEDYLCTSHTCMLAPEHCEDDVDCPGTHSCDEGKCIAVQGECGYVNNHQWNEYECCSNAACDDGMSCRLHRCVAIAPEAEYNVSIEIEDDVESVVGENLTIRVFGDEGPCLNCYVEVRSPSGNVQILMTDDTGFITISIDEAGQYEIMMMIDEDTIESTFVEAIQVDDAQLHTSQVEDLLQYVFLFMLFAILVGSCAIYWKIRR